MNVQIRLPLTKFSMNNNTKAYFKRVNLCSIREVLQKSGLDLSAAVMTFWNCQVFVEMTG
jgi:hypothetical protein